MKEKEELFESFKQVLNIVGYDITATDYDRLKILPKPDRKTLINRLGKTWVELKADANPLGENIRNQYLVIQNKSLMTQLEIERNKTKAFLDNCMAEISKVSFKPFPIPTSEKAKESLEFHAIRSDAHVGERTDSEYVQGLANYDIKTYEKRLNKWVERVLTFREQDKGFLGLNKLVINHLGDQVGGEAIYKGQSFYLDASLVQQLFISVEKEASALITLAQVFPEIEVYGVVGNHGRPGAKGENHHGTNFDYIFYRCLQQWCIQQKNIKIFVSESPSMIIQHGNFTFALSHGDSCKYWNGIPFYGLERMMRRLPDLYGMVINYFLTAHFHQAANIGDKIIINGCFPGGSDLSINKMGISSIPSQKIFYFDGKHGINRESDIYLEEKPILKKDRNGIYTSYN